MRENKLRALWAQGKAAVNGWLAIPNSFAAEVTIRAPNAKGARERRHRVQESADRDVRRKCLDVFQAFRRELLRIQADRGDHEQHAG